MYVSLRGHLYTPYVCVIKGLPVHHTSVSSRGYLYTIHLFHQGVTCTPYICFIKGLPVHYTSVSLRGYLCILYVCVVNVFVVKGLPLYTLCMWCTLYICVIKGLPVHHTSVSLRG